MHDDPTVDGLLIDDVMPVFDVCIAECLVVRADPRATFAGARALDFLRVHSPLLDAAMWARGLPDRLTGHAAETPARLVLGEGDPMPGWLVLGERPEHDLAFGAVGRFWQPQIVWHDVDPAEFVTFEEPGWGKIVATFAVVPYGTHAALLTYECRTHLTDPASRRAFRRYWWLVRPFVAHIFRATLRTIRDDVERAVAAEDRTPPPVSDPEPR
ncbi:MAG: hypothetical protein ACHQIG_13245 [Acidimicrobiia bacterium]